MPFAIAVTARKDGLSIRNPSLTSRDIADDAMGIAALNPSYSPPLAEPATGMPASRYFSQSLQSDLACPVLFEK